MLSDAHISSLGYLWGNSAFFRVQGTRLLNTVKKVAHVSDCILARVPHMTARILIVWYAKEASIAETSVKTLLKSVDFTIFKLTE